MMKDGLACAMHPKAPLIAGIAIVVFTLLGIYSAPVLLWLNIIVGAALIYAGATGKCYLSGMMSKCCSKSSDDSAAP